MPKIILEKSDIEHMIKTKYKDAEIVEGLAEDMEITIRVKELQLPPTIQQKQEVQYVPKKEVLLSDGSVDAKASGLTLEPRPVTVPGGAMGRTRGRMKTF